MGSHWLFALQCVLGSIFAYLFLCWFFWFLGFGLDIPYFVIHLSFGGHFDFFKFWLLLIILL